MNRSGHNQRSVKSLWHTLRDIFGLSKPYRTRFWLATVSVLIGSAIWLTVPLGLRELLDAVFESENRSLLNLLAVGLFGLFLAQALFSFLGNYHLEWVGERAVTDLRKRVYRHLHRLGFRFYADRRLGEITSRLTKDRKSTRLNSSHVAISYAVFSWKKKSSHQPRTRWTSPKTDRGCRPPVPQRHECTGHERHSG